MAYAKDDLHVRNTDSLFPAPLTDELRSQSATSLTHSRSTEDVTKLPNNSPRFGRRCSLQYQPSSLVINKKTHGNNTLSVSLSKDKKHHGSASSVSSSKDKKFHGSANSLLWSKDKKFHKSSNSFLSSNDKKDKHFHHSFSSLDKHDKVKRSDSEDSTHSHKKLRFRKTSAMTTPKPKGGHRRSASYGGHSRLPLSKLKKEKEREAIERLKKKGNGINPSWLASARYPLLQMFGRVVSQKCKNCCCTIL